VFLKFQVNINLREFFQPVCDERSPVLLFFLRFDSLRQPTLEMTDDKRPILLDKFCREFCQDIEEAHVTRQVLAWIDFQSELNSPFVKFADCISRSICIKPESQGESSCEL